VFKNTKTGRVDQFQGTDIDEVKWLKRARGYCLKIVLHSGHIHRFDGFKETVRYRFRYLKKVVLVGIIEIFLWRLF
jgi:hypothetical protein